MLFPVVLFAAEHYNFLLFVLGGQFLSFAFFALVNVPVKAVEGLKFVYLIFRHYFLRLEHVRPFLDVPGRVKQIPGDLFFRRFASFVGALWVQDLEVVRVGAVGGAVRG